jgi:hypothetical protein
VDRVQIGAIVLVDFFFRRNTLLRHEHAHPNRKRAR